MAAQPPWQLPTMAGFSLRGCSSRTLRTNCFSASHTSISVWPGLGIAEEDDEVDRMPGAHGDADLRVVLESADAGPVTGARIDDDVGTQRGIDRDAFGRHDAHERVVDRPLQLAAVLHHLVAKCSTGGSPACVCCTKLLPRWRIVSQNRIERCVASTA